ncbi:hypothetical protein R6Q57_022567 [Mikania cordata]
MLVVVLCWWWWWWRPDGGCGGGGGGLMVVVVVMVVDGGGDRQMVVAAVLRGCSHGGGSNTCLTRFLVSISAISAGYALISVVSSWVKNLMNKAWIFFVCDQVVTYLMVACVGSIGEILYLAYNGNQKVTWSEACSSYGRFCGRLNLILVKTGDGDGGGEDDAEGNGEDDGNDVGEDLDDNDVQETVENVDNEVVADEDIIGDVDVGEDVDAEEIAKNVDETDQCNDYEIILMKF